MYYYTCPHCEGNLDPGERCDCQKVKEKEVKDIANEPAKQEKQLVMKEAV